MRRWQIGGALAVVLCALGCHPEVEMIPLADRTIYATDRFYDVQALSPDRAVVVGYGGKIVETTDGGRTWTARQSPSDLALYSLHFVDEQVGWISGQDGLILHTTDGGKTWEKQESNAIFEDQRRRKQPLFLFGCTRSTTTTPGPSATARSSPRPATAGRPGRARKVSMETDLSGGQSLAAADPIFYDVKFVDAKNGWIVGEFGKIMYTENGGETWHEQEKTLLEGRTSSTCSTSHALRRPHARRAERRRGGPRGTHRAHEGRRQALGLRRGEGRLSARRPAVQRAPVPDGRRGPQGSAGEVVHREPGRDTWTRAKLGQDVPHVAPRPQLLDKDHGWMVGGYGLIYRTTDGGKTWLPSQG
jgi:photosystem II stability/assembly factor-like uncharacterized protein